MSPPRPDPVRSRRLCPGLERLEARAVPAAHGVHAAAAMMATVTLSVDPDEVVKPAPVTFNIQVSAAGNVPVVLLEYTLERRLNVKGQTQNPWKPVVTVSPTIAPALANPQELVRPQRALGPYNYRVVALVLIDTDAVGDAQQTHLEPFPTPGDDTFATLTSKSVFVDVDRHPDFNPFGESSPTGTEQPASANPQLLGD